jgi:hypothetical protein
MLRIIYETTDEDFNWKISITGIIFMVLRFWFMTAFFTEVDGELYVFPELLHTSFWISNLMCLAMVFSFRVKPLNVVALAILPTVVVTIFVHDIPLLTNPESTIWGSFTVGSTFWFNSLTIHIPVPFIALYMFITRKETISRPAFILMMPVVLGWFWFLDDKENGTAFSGDMYLIIAAVLVVVWTSFYLFIICYDVKNVDPLIAKVVHLKKIEWIPKSAGKVKNTVISES